MKIIGISGSGRHRSTNTALLTGIRDAAPSDIRMSIFNEIHNLPVFSPDLEGDRTPASIETFMKSIADADGVIISSPEYVRAIPGGLKNAIDWMVSREEIVTKPIALVHASHRGDDMLGSLRLVLSTVSQKFDEHLFLRIPLTGKAPDEIRSIMREADISKEIEAFLRAFASMIEDDLTR